MRAIEVGATVAEPEVELGLGVHLPAAGVAGTKNKYKTCFQCKIYYMF